VPGRVSTAVVRAIEAELSEPRFLGVPLGPTLSDFLWLYLWGGEIDWRRACWLSRARSLWYWLHPRRNRASSTDALRGRILVTWSTSSPRFDEMLRPVITELEDELVVLHWSESVLAQLPSGVHAIGWDQVMSYDVKAWRREYRRCRPAWEEHLLDVCRRQNLPHGTFQLLSANLMVASQRVAGCLEFLARARPALVLTEYDRNNLWSCLVLAARRLGIPSVTLVHGVIDQDAVGFSPVLADAILCWGDLDRRKLLAVGEPPEKLVVTGCPRLSRELSAGREEARVKLALDPARRVAMFATSPGPGGLELAELFCTAIDSVGYCQGLVRLHPSERIALYAQVMRRHTRIRFVENAETTLDESLAAADVVVVSTSGLGSDALVKRRPVVVVNSGPVLVGSDWDLVERAGCPWARTAGELSYILTRFFDDDEYRHARAADAERYVADLCSAFGTDSARLVARIVKQFAHRPSDR
jgi:hypothetical protein